MLLTLCTLFHQFSSSFCPLKLGGMNQKQTLVHSNSSSTSRNPGCVCIFSLKYLQLYRVTVLCGNVCLCPQSCSYKLMSRHITFISNCTTRSIAQGSASSVAALGQQSSRGGIMNIFHEKIFIFCAQLWSKFKNDLQAVI